MDALQALYHCSLHIGDGPMIGYVVERRRVRRHLISASTVEQISTWKSDARPAQTNCMAKTEKKTQLLFSVTAADCDWSTMTAGGPGGQHQNRSQTAVRCVHRASGAVGEARDAKSQVINRRSAFERMANSKEFKSWHRLETARRMAKAESIEAMVNAAVDEAMNPANIKVEVQDEDGRWTNATVFPALDDSH